MNGFALYLGREKQHMVTAIHAAPIYIKPSDLTAVAVIWLIFWPQNIFQWKI